MTGLIELSYDDDSNLLAYPVSNTTGTLCLFNMTNLKEHCSIKAHESPVVAIAFNHSYTQIATAGEKGTIIRIFSVTNGERLLEFRRGIIRCVKIASLAFSPCNNYVCCSSDTETVHIFNLEKLTPQVTKTKSNGVMG